MAKRKFEDLNLKDAFLFGAALEDEETCRLSLELMLGREISSVTVHAEHTIFYNSDYRSVRLDIFATDEEQSRYNVEMQGVSRGNLARRSRLYQAQLDASALTPGESFETLPPGYVIFVCAFDPFGSGLYRYTFENRCLETGMPLEDGARKIFLSTRGTDDSGVPEGLVHFLKYVEESTESCARSLGDETVNRIHRRVEELKKSREWGQRYMKFEELLKDAREEGMEEGTARMQRLIERMTTAGEAHLTAKLSDTDFLNEMYEKHQI